MNKLYTILTKMMASLDELEAIIVEEVNHLNRARINPVSLQVLSDNKNQLLSSIQFYDEMRRQEEHHSSLEAPYRDYTKLFVTWQAISKKVESTKDLNLKVANLLHNQMKKNEYVQKIANSVGHTNTLYGPAGESNPVMAGRKYNISI